MSKCINEPLMKNLSNCFWHVSKDRHHPRPPFSTKVKIHDVCDMRIHCNAARFSKGTTFRHTSFRDIDGGDIPTLFCQKHRVTTLPIGNAQNTSFGYQVCVFLQEVVWGNAIHVLLVAISLIPHLTSRHFTRHMSSPCLAVPKYTPRGI